MNVDITISMWPHRDFPELDGLRYEERDVFNNTARVRGTPCASEAFKIITGQDALGSRALRDYVISTVKMMPQGSPYMKQLLESARNSETGMLSPDHMEWHIGNDGTSFYKTGEICSENVLRWFASVGLRPATEDDCSDPNSNFVNAMWRDALLDPYRCHPFNDEFCRYISRRCADKARDATCLYPIAKHENDRMRIVQTALKTVHISGDLWIAVRGEDICVVLGR